MGFLPCIAQVCLVVTLKYGALMVQKDFIKCKKS